MSIAKIVADIKLLSNQERGELLLQIAAQKLLPLSSGDNCSKCGVWKRHEELYDLVTSKWGYENVFCEDCAEVCVGCNETFAPSMSHYHEDCTDICEKCTELYPKGEYDEHKLSCTHADSESEESDTQESQ